MQYMNNVLVEGEIAEDAGVAIEYKVPLTSKRVDFILTGRDADDCDTAVIVELKQWSDVTATTKDAVVETWVGQSFREVAHPSYQAWTYAALIRDFNSAVQDGDIRLEACAYLHNCTADHVIKSTFYKEHTDKAPAFLRTDAAALRDIQNLGENQVKEIIQAAKLSIFFIDEDQRVTFKDIGEMKEIQRWAEACRATVTELKLESQFRCNGSDGYLAWVNHALQIADTANPTLDGIDYDFRVLDSPNQLFDLIVAHNAVANKARVVAGYCWDWKGKKDPAIKDVVIEKHGFAKRWNLHAGDAPWLVAPNSVNEIGCIHTCQGLELDYIGVIVGPDLVVRDGAVVTDAAKRSSQDHSVRGYKSM